MTIRDFVTSYNNCTNEDATDDLLNNGIQYRDYVPHAEKLATAEAIARATTHGIGSDGNFDMTFKSNRPMRKFLTELRIVSMYTDIAVDFDDANDEYDALEQDGLIAVILNHLDPHEVHAFEDLVQLCVDDIMDNEFGWRAATDRIAQVAGTAAGPALEKLGDAISGLDDDKIRKIGETLARTADRFVK